MNNVVFSSSIVSFFSSSLFYSFLILYHSFPPSLPSFLPSSQSFPLFPSKYSLLVVYMSVDVIVSRVCSIALRREQPLATSHTATTHTANTCRLRSRHTHKINTRTHTHTHTHAIRSSIVHGEPVSILFIRLPHFFSSFFLFTTGYPLNPLYKPSSSFLHFPSKEEKAEEKEEENK